MTPQREHPVPLLTPKIDSWTSMLVGVIWRNDEARHKGQTVNRSADIGSYAVGPAYYGDYVGRSARK